MYELDLPIYGTDSLKMEELIELRLWINFLYKQKNFYLQTGALFIVEMHPEGAIQLEPVDRRVEIKSIANFHEARLWGDFFENSSNWVLAELGRAMKEWTYEVTA